MKSKSRVHLKKVDSDLELQQINFETPAETSNQINSMSSNNDSLEDDLYYTEGINQVKNNVFSVGKAIMETGGQLGRPNTNVKKELKPTTTKKIDATPN